MKRFQMGEFDGLNFSKAVEKKEAVKFIQVDEEFQAGTFKGIQHGNKGDFLIVSNGSFQVLSKDKFSEIYEVIEVAAPVKKAKGEKVKKPEVKIINPVKKAAKKAPSKKGKK